MVKITNLSTAHLSITGSDLAPGQSKNVEVITASLDRLIQSGALKAETVVVPVVAPVIVRQESKQTSYPEPQAPEKTFKFRK